MKSIFFISLIFVLCILQSTESCESHTEKIFDIVLKNVAKFCQIFKNLVHNFQTDPLQISL